MNDAYDHAPECDVSIWMERAIETDAPRWLGVPDDVACQCQKLQVCEARVLSVAGPHNYTRGRKDGYAAGVHAARDAVEALCDCVHLNGKHASSCAIQDAVAALAAIEALREEKK